MDVLVDQGHLTALGCHIGKLLNLNKSKGEYEVDKKAVALTKVQVPLLTMTTNPLRSGVLSGSGSHASSTTVVSVLVAKIGSVAVTGNGKVSKYVIGSCATPCTVAFCRGMTVLSSDATEIALMPLPGLDVKNAPLAPSLPVQAGALKPYRNKTKQHGTCSNRHNLAGGGNAARKYRARALSPSISTT